MKFSSGKKIFLFLATLFFIFSSNAQTGSIKGILMEEDTIKNYKAVGASVVLKPLGKKVVSKIDGSFEFKNLAAGTYSITISGSIYKAKTITNIQVVKDNTTDLGIIRIGQDVAEVGTGRKVTYRPKTTIATGVVEEKKSTGVANVMTNEQMSRGQDGDVAKAAARIPGVTIMEGRFIQLRGLSQRYNSVQINNINAPSTEVDRRAFSFDLIPTSMIDRMAVYKSPSSDISGDFAGGVIKLQTKSTIEKDFVSISFGLGYRINSTFMAHQNNSVGSFTDMFGFDNGNRSIPSSFPSNLADYSNSQAIAFGKNLNNNFKMNNMFTPLDFGFGVGYGKNFKIGKSIKGYSVNSFGYSTNYQYASIRRYRYQNDQTTANGVRQMFDYMDDNFTIESKINFLSNWIFKKGTKTTYTFSNIFNQIGENETTIREGINPTERPTDEFKNYSFHYTSRSIYFGQLDGLHKLRSKDEKLNYTIGFSSINRNEPDYRRFRTFRTVGSNGDYTLIDPPSSSLFDAARFYSKLKEYTVSATANYENQFTNFLDTNTELTFKAGVYAENKNREFNARWISYSYAGDPTKKNDFLKTPIDQIFAPENINPTSGFKPSEGTNPSDQYTANNQLGAAYLFTSFPYSRFKFNLGVRAEYFNQTLKSATLNGPVNINLPNINILPSINTAIYFDSAYDKTLLRLTYGRTVNRPEFRELAPFVYYDFMYDVNIVGNPDLKSATIDNVDMRFETYPSAGESFSFGVFYKKFVNPIESYVQPIGLSQQYYLKNASSAQNFGIEMEIRRDFKNRTQDYFLKHLSAIINASYIYSKVDLGADSTLSQARTRPLQGQSPYIVNASIQYATDSSWKINVAYNIIGKRIVYVGNNIFPTIYEMPRHSLDITFSREISKTFTLKFGVSDVLNYKHQLWQDTDGDGKISYKNDIDQQLLVFRRGQMFNLGLTFKFK